MAIYQIELTNHCNARCEWCGNMNMLRKRGFMSSEVFRAALDYLQCKPPVGNTVGLHHFGESLLHSDIDSFFLLLQQKGIRWRLSTNGILLKQKEIRKMLLSYAGLLVVSLENGADTEDIIQLLSEKKRYSSRLRVQLQSFGPTDFSPFSSYEYEIRQTTLHSWAKKGSGEYSRCCFLNQDWVCVLWDGSFTACCMDLEGEALRGSIGGDRIRNAPWRACKTCEVVEQCPPDLAKK